MNKFAVVGVGLAFGAAAFCLKDVEMTAPMQTKSGKHVIATCTDKKTGEQVSWNTKETTAIWRPLGSNSWEFNDAVTGKKQVLLEGNMSAYSCKVTKFL